jgi:membrane-bound metal-dependent hydrolase YbcI (DUF457 family)
MDTITHGIAGALLSKSVFGGGDLIQLKPLNKKRLITWVLVLGAMFPDIDVLRETFSSNEMLIVTWHRSITHSLLCLPIWAGILAALTLAVAKWRKWEAPSFMALFGLWAVAIFSHIFLDLVTTFGTMIWSPLGWSRPAWDLLFIVDFTFTAILLIPQLLAWTFEDPKHNVRRATILWLIFAPSPLVIAKIGESVGAPISHAAVITAMVLFTGLFMAPALSGTGQFVGYRTWNRLGLGLAVAYLLAVTYAHHVALDRVRAFAATLHLEVQSVAATPMPPSMWHWNGLVLTPRGVYETRMDLSDSLFGKGSEAKDPNAIERTYYRDADSNAYIERARQLKPVQELLWFSRFPVTWFHREGSNAVVEIFDARFPQIRRDRPRSFTYRVEFSPSGEILSQGWEKPDKR